MIAVDSNILVYAHRPESEFHAAASATLHELANGSAAWSIPWPCIHEFYGTATNRQVFRPPSSVEDALDQIAAWLESPSLVLLAETSQHRAVLGSLVQEARVVGPRVHDARIAAICISHGVAELVTMDRDFSRFPQLRTRSLLV